MDIYLLLYKIQGKLQLSSKYLFNFAIIVVVVCMSLMLPFKKLLILNIKCIKYTINKKNTHVDIGERYILSLVIKYIISIITVIKYVIHSLIDNL